MMSPPKDRLCTNCKFWKPNKNYPQDGQCRFNPPVVLMLGQPYGNESERLEPDFHNIWPNTSATDWCGKFAESSHIPGVPDNA